MPGMGEAACPAGMLGGAMARRQYRRGLQAHPDADSGALAGLGPYGKPGTLSVLEQDAPVHIG